MSPPQQDWLSLGVVEVPGPGRYEVVSRRGSVLGVVPFADELPAGARLVDHDGVAHLCVPCGCCGACGCGSDHDDLCGWCAKYAAWADRARPAVTAYRRALAAPSRTLVTQNVGGSRLVHTLDCPSQLSRLEAVEQALEGGCPHSRRRHDPRWPELAAPGELIEGRRCRVCSPDAVPPRPRDMRFGSPDRALDQDK